MSVAAVIAIVLGVDGINWSTASVRSVIGVGRKITPATVHIFRFVIHVVKFSVLGVLFCMSYMKEFSNS